MKDIRQAKYYKYAKKIIIILGRQVVALRKLRADYLIGLSVLVLFIVQMIELEISNNIGTMSLEAAELQKAMDTVKLHNAVLKSQLEEAMSYRVIATRAAEQGFTVNGAERILNIK